MDKTVVCVLWVGDFRRRTYSPIWVQKLKAMIDRHMLGYRFVCLSNVPVRGVETIPLRDNLPGWYSKIEMFRPGLFKGRLLYIDLDVLVLKSLVPLFDHPGDFVAMKSDVERPTRIEEGKRVTCGLNSGTLAWTAGAADRLYTDFRRCYIEELRGDQDWITEQYRDPAFFPRPWFARLRDCPGGPPQDCRILHCMPWKNEVAAKRFAWVREIWG